MGRDELVRKSGLPQREVEQWLSRQNVHTLHKPARRRFPTRRVLVSSIDDQWQADLVDMQKFKTDNDSANYILTVIDIFSKYAWAQPITRKTGDEVTEAFRRIFADRVPRKLQTDKGLEFINKQTQGLFRERNVRWFATENETKAQVVERFNRTLKSKMWKYFTANNTKKWIDILNDLLKNYNSTYHRSIKMKPKEASLVKNSATVYQNLFPEENDLRRKPRFHVGDTVRISKKYGDFRKGYLPNFTTEVFVVSRVLETSPPTYNLTDSNNEEIIGTFYEEEMVKYLSDKTYVIESVLREKGNRLLVKWKGYKAPSWIEKRDLVRPNDQTAKR